MKLDDGQIVTLEYDQEYIVIKEMEYNNMEYVYLMSSQKPISILIAKKEIINNEIILNPIEDKEEIKSIINLLK